MGSAEANGDDWDVDSGLYTSIRREQSRFWIDIDSRISAVWCTGTGELDGKSKAVARVVTCCCVARIVAGACWSGDEGQVDGIAIKGARARVDRELASRHVKRANVGC